MTFLTLRCEHKHKSSDGYWRWCVRRPGHWRRHLDTMGERWR